MQRHRTSNNIHHKIHGGKVLRGQGIRPGPEPPPLKEGEHRCECGAAVRLNKDGLLRGHKTLVNKVSCIHAYTPPKEEA